MYIDTDTYCGNRTAGTTGCHRARPMLDVHVHHVHVHVMVFFDVHSAWQVELGAPMFCAKASASPETARVDTKARREDVQLIGPQVPPGW